MKKKLGRPKKENSIPPKPKKTPEELRAIRLANILPYVAKPGEIKNPDGRPSVKIGLPPEGRGGTIDGIKLQKMISIYLAYSLDELNTVLSDPDMRVTDKIICRALIAAQISGRLEQFEQLLRRAMGAVEQSMKVGVGPLSDLSKEEQIKAGRAALEALEKQKEAREREEQEDRLTFEKAGAEKEEQIVILDPDNEKEESASESLKWLET